MHGAYSMTVRERGLKTVWRRSGLRVLLLVPGLALWNSVIAAPDGPSRALLRNQYRGFIRVHRMFRFRISNLVMTLRLGAHVPGVAGASLGTTKDMANGAVTLPPRTR
jgi:hypothetical protein